MRFVVSGLVGGIIFRMWERRFRYLVKAEFDSSFRDHLDDVETVSFAFRSVVSFGKRSRSTALYDVDCSPAHRLFTPPAAHRDRLASFMGCKACTTAWNGEP